MRKWINLIEDVALDGNKALLDYFEERPVDISYFTEEWSHFIDTYVSDENIEHLLKHFQLANKADLKPWVYNELSPRGKSVFADYLEDYNILGDVLHDDPQGAPAWMLLQPTGGLLPPTTKVIHITDNAEQIAREGFRYGGSDPDKIALTIRNDIFGNTTRTTHDGPGYNFGYLASGYDFRRNKWRDGGIHRGAYGKSAVLVETGGMEVYHKGDREKQVIFWGPSAKVLKVLDLSLRESFEVSWKPLDPRLQDSTTVVIDVEKVMQDWQRDRDFYIDGPQHGNAIKGRYERFGEWIKDGKPVIMPELYLNPWGGISFGNGRHRFVWLRDQGVKTMPVEVPKEEAEEIAKRFGPNK